MIEDDANPDQIDPRVLQAIRDLEDANYEASTSFPQPHFRTNLARRHRFGRVQDMPRPTPAQINAVSTAVGWVVAMVIAVLAYAAWALFA